MTSLADGGPSNILDQLRQLAETIRSAEAEGATRHELLVLWRRRREIVLAAIAAEYRPADIGRAAGVTRERVYQIAG
jgi:hypothetical protein